MPCHHYTYHQILANVLPGQFWSGSARKLVSIKHWNDPILACVYVCYHIIYLILSGFCPSKKDTRSVCFLNCIPAWDKKMGADEIRQKIKWHRAIWSPPELWKLGWGFGVRGSTPHLSAWRKTYSLSYFWVTVRLMLFSNRGPVGPRGESAGSHPWIGRDRSEIHP